MSYTKEELDKLNTARLKLLYQKILAHKTALSEEESKKTGSSKKKREDMAKKVGLHHFVFDKELYGALSRDKKKSYLVKKIMEIEPLEEIGDYKKEGDVVKYKELFEKGFDINPNSGRLISPEHKEKEPEHIEPQKKEEPQKSKIKQLQEKIIPHRHGLFIDAFNEFNDLEHSLKSVSDAYSISETQKEMMNTVIDMHKYKNVKDEDENRKLKHSIHTIVRSFQKEMENDNYNDEEMKEVLHSLKQMKKIEPEIDTGSDNILDKEISLFEGRIKVIDEQKKLREEEKEKQKIPEVKRRLEEEEKKQEYERHPISMNSSNNIEEPTTKEDKNIGNVKSIGFLGAMEEPTTKGDKNIGNVRSIGFLGPMEELAKEEDVITDETERSKSLRRFTNFRWVDSIQNSSLGYASPFQRLQDIEDRRRYSKCFIPKNKMPKPEPDEIELEKHKNFNKYELVPSYGLSSLPQPATEFSFKTSNNPFARKVNIDEKQFGDKKLYNFEGDGRPNTNPHNPFSASYGMEIYDQSNKNQNPKDNTLEFSSVLYSDDPFKRKHKLVQNHLQRTKIYYA